MQRLIFGEFDGRRSTRAEAFLDACLEGGINAELSTNILREIWEKYVFPCRLIRDHYCYAKCDRPDPRESQTRAFLLDVMREVVAVGNAHGVDLATDYAERRLALAMMWRTT